MLAANPCKDDTPSAALLFKLNFCALVPCRLNRAGIAARETNPVFLHSIRWLKVEMEMRNVDVAAIACFGLALGVTNGVLPYTVLAPGWWAGLTMHGVSYSVLI